MTDTAYPAKPSMLCTRRLVRRALKRKGTPTLAPGAVAISAL